MICLNHIKLNQEIQINYSSFTSSCWAWISEWISVILAGVLANFLQFFPKALFSFFSNLAPRGVIKLAPGLKNTPRGAPGYLKFHRKIFNNECKHLFRMRATDFLNFFGGPNIFFWIFLGRYRMRMRDGFRQKYGGWRDFDTWLKSD